MNVVFFGTPYFAADVLSFLISKGVNIKAVITRPDRPKGRSLHMLPTPVKVVAEKNSIPVFQPEKVSSLEFQPTIESFQADLFVVVAFGEIIKQHLLDMPKLGCINLHASLLPKYRGAAPIQRAIMEGEEKTGVTIMHMVKKMDAGDMIKKVEVKIQENDSFLSIEKKLCEVGSEALLEVIETFKNGTVTATPQEESQATYAQKIELEDCEIKWDNLAKNIHNLVRGATPFPGAWTYITIKGEKKRLKILKTEVINAVSESHPGQIMNYGKEDFIIQCGRGLLKIIELQLEGKKAMSAQEFMRGFQQNNIHFN